MKTIVLIRHGKSSWNYDVSDRNRPLKHRGISDAKLVANQFVTRCNLPEKIYSSLANRALSTCKIFTEIFNLKENSINIIEDLYDFGGENVINFIKNLSNDYDDVMIFGHNNALTSISNIFGSTFIDNLPTSGLVKLKFNINDWKNLEKGTTEFIIIPKELK